MKNKLKFFSRYKALPHIKYVCILQDVSPSLLLSFYWRVHAYKSISQKWKSEQRNKSIVHHERTCQAYQKYFKETFKIGNVLAKVIAAMNFIHGRQRRHQAHCMAFFLDFLSASLIFFGSPVLVTIILLLAISMP